jgi:hypothetical protein
MNRSSLSLLSLLSSALVVACGTTGLVSTDGDDGDPADGRGGSELAPPGAAHEGWSEPTSPADLGLAPTHQLPSWHPLPSHDLGDAPVTLFEASCVDLLDDDADGLPDCADPDCAADPSCQVGSGGLGDACTLSSDCGATSGYPLCLDEAYYGFVGGYCTELCQVGGDPCPGDGVCVGAGVGDWGACFDGCAVQTDCRRGTAASPSATSILRKPTWPSATRPRWAVAPTRPTTTATERSTAPTMTASPTRRASTSSARRAAPRASACKRAAPGKRVCGRSTAAAPGRPRGRWFSTSRRRRLATSWPSSSPRPRTGLYVVSSCTDPEGEIACSATGSVAFEAQQPGDGVYLVIDALSPSDAGAFSLTIEGV